MKSIIIYISTLCIVLTFVFVEKTVQNKDHLVFVIMKALLLLIQLSQKYNLIYGLAITFSMVYSIRRKLSNPILPNLDYFSWCKTYTFTLKDIYFQKHILFGNDSTRTVNASDFEYSLNRLLMKSRFSRRLGFTKRRKLQSQNDSILKSN
jgi:peptide/nickel transport system substrate-binding protein